MPDREAVRALLLGAFQAAISAVDPRSTVESHLAGNEKGLFLDDAYRTGDIYVFALGKAAVGMAEGAIDAAGDRVRGGLVVSGDGDVAAPLTHITGDHPFPGRGSLAAGRAAIELATGLSNSDLLLVLLSGGGSSLAEVPADGLSVEDLSDLQRRLMDAGTPIDQLNCVRRHLSKIKNGGLYRAAGDTRVVTMLLSDVVDSPRYAIASGPTHADDSTGFDALTILQERLGDELPTAVVECLGNLGPVEATTSDHPSIIVGSGSTAAHAARDHLRASGLPADVLSVRLRGDAVESARRLFAHSPSGVSIVSGETTVSGGKSGKGGRNQEAALGVAAVIPDASHTVFCALGTDGVDGPTDAAGAIVDSGTIERGRAEGLDLEAYLDRHDSYRYLDATNDLVFTGPTGTNVADLWMIAKS